MDKEKQKALTAATAQLQKLHGSEIIVSKEPKRVPTISSFGSFLIDNIVGVGGIPRGRILEFYGPEASGKSTLALKSVAECQKMDGIACFVDMEHALDPVWASRLGVNMKDLIISQPDYGEQALDVVEAYVKSGAVDLIVVDSVAAMVPRAELDGDFGDSNMGLHARLMSQAMRKLTALISKSNCSVIFINQIRMKIGVTGGNPETTSGGLALSFAASVRLEIRRQLGASIKDDEKGMTVAHMTVKAVKNKVSRPYKKAQLELFTGEEGIYGFNKYAEIIDLADTYNIVSKGGAGWFKFNDLKGNEQKIQGREKFAKFLEQEPELFEQIKSKVQDLLAEEDLNVVGSYNDVKAQEESKVLKEVEEKVEEIKEEKKEEETEDSPKRGRRKKSEE